jgi:RHS repeat-associated protein
MRVFRRLIGTVTGAALVASSLLVATQQPAVAERKPTPVVEDTTTRPDEVSAVSVARQHGHQVEVTNATSETTRRWANPDGTFTDEMYTGPVRVRKGEGWVPIDTNLSVRDGAVRPAAAVGDIAFSDGGHGAVASVSDGGVSLSLAWPDALPAPTIVGDTARYADVLPGVDLEVKALSAGFEQSFVLKNREAVRSSAGRLSLPLTLSGLSPVTVDGQLAFRGADGKDRAWVESAQMWDATGRTAPVGVASRVSGSSQQMAMTPDAEFLHDPSLVFPVTVDPVVQLFRSQDTYTDAANPNSHYETSGYLKIGKRTSTNIYVSYLQFNMSAYAGKEIVDAYTYLGNVDSPTCSAKTTTAYLVTSSWTASTVTASSHPTYQGSPTLATSTDAHGGPVGSACEANNWMTLHSTSLTDTYQAWADNNATNYGIHLRTDNTDTSAAKDFASGENAAWTPRVNITWGYFPGTPAGRYVTPAQLGSDNSTRYTSTTTPTLAGGSCDSDNDPVRIDFEVWNATHTGSALYQSSPSESMVPSCGIKQWTVPSALTNGTTYQWRARAYDGTDYSKAWSSWSPLVVDTTAPPTASITAASMSQNAWVTGVAPIPTYEDFTFTASPTTDVAGYYYGFDEPSPTTFTATASATILVPEGWHTVYVQTADKAGNRSTVTSFAFGYGYVGMTSPRDGAHTAQYLSFAGLANPNVATLKWQRLTPPGAFATIITLKDASNNTVSQPMSISSGVVPTTTWDPGAEGVSEGPVQLRAVVTLTGAPTTEIATRVVSVTFDREDFGLTNATEAAGPGDLNLLTGNLQVSATDASLDAYGSDLTVARTFNSRDENAQSNGPFGKGWVSSVPVTAADAEYTSLAVNGLFASVTLVGGDTIGFTRTSSGVTTFDSEYGHEDLKLIYVAAAGGNPERYDLKDLAGNATGFTKPTGATNFVPTSVLQTGDSASTTYAYEVKTINGESVTRATGIMAPQPSGLSGTCSLATPTAVVGCRSLKLTYFASSTTPPTGSNLGDYPDRVQKVEVIAWDPDLVTPVMSTVEIAHYSYNANGRLAEAWDPRLSTLKTTYTYNANGQLATITPPATEAWTIAYAPLATEASTVGRVKTVARPTLLASPTVATTTFVYGVPVSGAGAPYDLSSTELARIGQEVVPVTGTAVFPATTTATFGGGSLPVPSSYDHATVHYLDTDGREIDAADPNGGIDLREYDDRGSVTRTLSAGNRQRALDQGTSTAAEALVAESLSSLTVYSPDGLEVRETFGPEHNIQLSTTNGDLVRARVHSVNTYDEGTTGGPYHLLTTSVTSARVAGESTDRTSEARTTKTEYGTTTATWALGQPTASITDAVTGGLNLATRTTYSADGRVLTETLPAGGASTNTAATRVTRYYIAGTGSGDTACDSKPQWVNLICSVGPGGQPAGTPLPTSYVTYDMFNRIRVLTEKASGSTLRTTTVTYDSVGRATARDTTASTGTALQTLAISFDVNGRPTETQSKSGATVTGHVVRTFNSLGQVTTYTDTDGNVSSVTYDVVGHPVVMNDGKGTQTWTYDGGSERRGLATQLVDSHAGTWSATYGVDGTPTVDWPNGLRATPTFDETGFATSLTYAATSGCSGVACTVLSDSVHQSIHDQWLDQDSTLSSQVYTYDAAARLTRVDDTVADACTVRKYTHDAGAAGNSNRTKLETFESTDACQTTSATSTVNTTYDAADRILTSGTVYDTLGRTTTVPDTNALDSGAVTTTYYANDMVRSIGIAGGATKTYTLDVDQRRVRSWTDGTTVRTNHYNGDGDSPTWTQESATTWTRNIGGITGGMAATYDSATSSPSLLLTNLHGDVVATTSATSTDLVTTMEATEFGAPRGVTGRRYGWLGAAQRAADTPGGFTLMGARVYNPVTGRFLQVDPVYGGSLNPYEYGNADPINMLDLSGQAAADPPGGGSNKCVCTWKNDEWTTTSTAYSKETKFQTVYAPPGAIGEILTALAVVASGGYSIDKVELKWRVRTRLQQRCTLKGVWQYRQVVNRQYKLRVTLRYLTFLHQQITALKWSNEDWASKLRWT